MSGDWMASQPDTFFLFPCFQMSLDPELTNQAMGKPGLHLRSLLSGLRQSGFPRVSTSFSGLSLSFLHNHNNALRLEDM